MLCEELLHRFAGMVACSILNQDDLLCRLFEHRFQELCIALRGEAPLKALIKKASRKIFNQAKDFIAFSYSRRRNRGLLPSFRPRIGQSAPLGKRGLITK